jgi:hypothetical protein
MSERAKRYCISGDGEVFSYGGHPTREAAVAEGEEIYEAGDTFYVGVEEPVDARRVADRAIGDPEDDVFNALDDYHECVAESFRPSPESVATVRAKLRVVLEEWVLQECKGSWGVGEITRHVVPEAGPEGE